MGCEAHPQARPEGRISVVLKVLAERSIASGLGRDSGRVWSRTDPAPERDEPAQTSTSTVTGPSFLSSTVIRAPKRPPCAPSAARTRSYSGSAASGAAASV